MFICVAIKPNKGGIKVDPVYAKAICKPIIIWEYFLSKAIGA